MRPAGGEFAFVAFGEAVARGVLPVPITNLLYLVVALSMALTPYLAALGGMLGQLLDQKDTKALQPKESETKELNDHVIILGYGRSGQLIAQVGCRWGALWDPEAASAAWAMGRA